MNHNSCYELGVIAKPHGLKGEVQIFLDVDSSDDYSKLESVFVEINKQLVPFFIESIHVVNDKKAIVAFDDIQTFEQATELRGAHLYLPLEFLPKLKDNQFYYHDVVGYTVVDQNDGELGKAATFNDGGAQVLLIMDYKDKEVLIPVCDTIFLKADHNKKQILVNLPEGLLELYLNED